MENNGGGDCAGGQERRAQGDNVMYLSGCVVVYLHYIFIYTHAVPESARIGQQARTYVLYALCPVHLSFPLPNPRGETRRGELAQSDPGSSTKVSTVLFRCQPLQEAFMNTSLHPICFSVLPKWLLPCTGNMLFHVSMSFPADCITLSALYPHHLYRAAHTDAH